MVPCNILLLPCLRLFGRPTRSSLSEWQQAQHLLGLQASGLQDGGGGRPTYTLRTLGRALEYARTAVTTYGLQRALYDGAAMAFQTQLQPASMPVLEGLLCLHLLGSAHRPKVAPIHLAHKGMDHITWR